MKTLKSLVLRLRAASPAEQARLLRSTLNDSSGGGVHGITTALLDGIAEGSAPPAVIRAWIGVSRSPEAVASAFFQRNSVFTRDIAIKYIYKMLRKDETFETTWKALRGASGIGNYLAKLSINQHRDLCAALGRLHKPGGGHIQRLRRDSITELYDFLMDTTKNTKETRPVKPVYARLLPACTPERAAAYLEALDVENVGCPKRLKEKERLLKTDWNYFEQRALEKICDPSNNTIDLKSLRILVDHSQEFGLRILEVLADDRKIRISDSENFNDCLALPLARRCPKTHRSNPDIEGHNLLWKLINMAVKRHPQLRREIERPFRPRYYGAKRQVLEIMEHAAVSWNYCRGDKERSDHLAELVRFLSSSWFSWERIGRLMRFIAPVLRYEFLRIWLANSASHRRDIGRVDGSGSMSLKGLEIPVRPFTLLGAADSLRFFERCSRENPDNSFLISGYRDCPNPTILRQQQEPGTDARPDFHIVRSFLIKRVHPQKIVVPANPEHFIEEMSSTELERRKTLAVEAKDPGVRGFWALSAMRLCVALRDFDLINGTVTWARRFNKDPLAVKLIYPWLDITPFLACGTMNEGDPIYSTREGLKRRIDKGNDAVKSLLNTVIMIQNERSFVNKGFWDRKTVQLPAKVAILRLRRVKELQCSLQLTDEEIFESLLQPTLELLIDAESALIDHDSVDSRDQSPLVSFGSDQIGYAGNPPGTAELRFWDSLARKRDRLWEQKRSEKHSEVMTLPFPWPRGLPLQELIPREMQFDLRVPYVIQRAEAIVFCDPGVVMQSPPEDKETQDAIGSFINSYASALRLWVRAVEDKHERQLRITKAWDYALGPLTADRMSPEEAREFWYAEAFSSAEESPEVSVRWDFVRFPAPMPFLNDSNTASEWNPDPRFDHKTVSASHKLDRLTQLDCMLYQGSGHLSEMSKPYSKSVCTKTFWSVVWNKDVWRFVHRGTSCENRRGTSHSIMDALIAAAILTIDAVYGRESSLMKNSFPTSKNVRYPAMYLDQDFLEREYEEAWQTIWVLESLRAHVPPQLLAQLAESLWAKLRQTTETQHGQYSRIVTVIKLIINSDDPSLSIPIIHKFVAEVHDASSYFREIFGIKLMNRLSSEDAATLYDSLTKHIMFRLSEQKEGNKSSDQRGEGISSPVVKITTLKMLAQIPQEGSALGKQRSLDTLCNLFRQSSHIDVKSVALNSLRSAAVDKESQQFVNEFIDQWAVQIAGSLNERRIHTEGDWATAEQGGPMPEVDKEHPILDMLLANDSLNTESGFSAAWKALSASAENNARWMRLFVERHAPVAGCEPDSKILNVPARREFLVTYVSLKGKPGTACSDEEARALLDVTATIKSHVLYMMDPPLWITALTKHVSSSAKLSSSNAGQHWLDMWHSEGPEHPCARYHGAGGNWACETLNEFTIKEGSGSQQVQFYHALEGFVSEMARLCLRKGNVEALMAVVDRLQPQWNGDRGVVDEERGPGGVIRRMIVAVERLRTPEWQSNPLRQPRRLPDPILLRIKLLRLPGMKLEDEIPSDRSHVDQFVEKVIKIVHLILNDNLPYETRFRELRVKVGEVCERAGKEGLYVASLLGNVNKDLPGLADMLRVRLAVFLMNETTEVDQWETQGGVACQEMVQKWEESVVEDLREQAFELKRAVRDKFAGRRDVLRKWFS